jgi:predicted Zn-dependent protease
MQHISDATDLRELLPKDQDIDFIAEGSFKAAYRVVVDLHFSMVNVVRTAGLILFSVSLVMGQGAVAPVVPQWTPPTPRTKNWTIFAPKPFAGDNIFKGEAENWLAEAISQSEVSYLKPISDKAVSDYVNQVGQNLVKYSAAPAKHFEFVVIDGDEEDAFSVGGGRIYIYLGELKADTSEDELAAVLAHEIGHDTFLHAPKTVTRQMFWMTHRRKVTSLEDTKAALKDLMAAYEKNTFATVGEVLLGWARMNELEADKAGFYTMFKAGYNPEAMKNVFRRDVAETKEREGKNYAAMYFLTLLFGSHPPSAQRVTALKWESNWVKMPPKESQYKNPAFDAIKERVKHL